ncbi:MAG: CCA tRNA nucleotidyltransferase [Anaerolineales bacterium]
MQKDDLLRLMHDPSLLPPERQTLLTNIAAQAAALNMPCYLVGGFVRDLMLNKPVNDLDIVLEGDAIKLGRSLVKKFGGKLTPHDKFQTAIWSLPEPLNLQAATLDLITARKETYEDPGALPTVVAATIEDDLRRRDFAINAMAIRIDGDHFGELLDPLNGQADLKKRIIRVLHPRSFIDDPTRIFRAIRYEGRYSFNLDFETLNLIGPEALAVISQLSGERIRHELDLIFEEQGANQMILRVASLGILNAIHVELLPLNLSYANLLERDLPVDIPGSRTTLGYILWFMDLSEDGILSIAKRLDFTSDMTYSVWAAAQVKKSLPVLVNSKPSEWTAALEKFPPISIYVAYLVSHENALLDYLSMWRHVKPHTTGDDLKARGLQPGPRYGEILSLLRTAWLDGDVKDQGQENEFLDTLL